MTKDTGAPAQDAEIIISIFNPFREKLNSYRGYDIRHLQSRFRSITVLKNRYGESDIEVGCAFYGASSVFAELPKPEEIYDYSKYDTSSWILGKEDNKDTNNQSNNKFLL